MRNLVEGQVEGSQSLILISGTPDLHHETGNNLAQIGWFLTQVIIMHGEESLGYVYTTTGSEPPSLGRQTHACLAWAAAQALKPTRPPWI